MSQSFEVCAVNRSPSVMHAPATEQGLYAGECHHIWGVGMSTPHEQPLSEAQKDPHSQWQYWSKRTWYISTKWRCFRCFSFVATSGYDNWTALILWTNMNAFHLHMSSPCSARRSSSLWYLHGCSPWAQWPLGHTRRFKMSMSRVPKTGLWVKFGWKYAIEKWRFWMVV